MLNPPWNHYPPAALQACQRVLGTLVKRLGAQHAPRLVVIGGLVPNLLLQDSSPDPLVDRDPHPGTNDVDLCVQLDISDDDADLYQDLERVLREGGFVRSQRSDGKGESVWRWQKTVDDVVVGVEFLAPLDGVSTSDVITAVGRIAKDERTQKGDEIGALRIRGAALAHLDAQKTELEIELLDDGGIANVNVWVANILPFVVLKSFAVHGREKDKDAFDLVWLLTNWQRGPSGAAQAARRSVVVSDPEVADAMTILQGAFQTIKHEGCVRYARFIVGAKAPAEERTIHARFAHGAIKEFLQTWNGADTATDS